MQLMNSSTFYLTWWKRKALKFQNIKTFQTETLIAKKNLGGKLSEEYNIGFDNEFCSWYAVRFMKKIRWKLQNIS